MAPPRRDASQAAALHGSLLPGAERQRGKAQTVLELSLRHWMAHEPQQRSLGGLGVLSEPLSAAVCGCLRVLRGEGQCQEVLGSQPLRSAPSTPPSRLSMAGSEQNSDLS